MLAKMIDKIVALKETKTFEIAGQTYADAPLTRIPPHVDRPDCISVSGLDGICKLIRTELAKINTVIMVQAKSYKSVEVMTTYLPDFSRNILYRAEADVPGLRTGFHSREVALIELRSLFIPNEGTAYLLDLLSRMTDENSVSTKDNGVTQTVEARQGVALNALVEVKPPHPAPAVPHLPRGASARERVPAARRPQRGDRLLRGRWRRLETGGQAQHRRLLREKPEGSDRGWQGRRHEVNQKGRAGSTRSAI